MIIPFERFAQFVDKVGNLTLRATSFLEEIVAVEDWQEVGVGNAPAFQNTWASLGSPHNQAGYYKDAFNIVRLQGHITGGTGGATAFTLPTGYYSGFDHEYICFGSGGGGGPGPGGIDYAIVLVDASGNVIPDVNTGADVSLDGIFFRV